MTLQGKLELLEEILEADVLTVGDLEERVALVDKLMQDDKIAFLQEYTARKKKEVAHRGEEPENA